MTNAEKRSIGDLSDYAALEQLAEALWSGAQSKGAAVLVGAGFSRNAELAGEDTPLPPRWSDLHAAMARELYKDRSREAPKDSLRLADEFRIYFGQAALTEFLHRQIADASWKPGTLHRTLMALPWADVLTTNYDTLLERATYRHRAVRNESDLGQIRGARVIKLHGSIDADTHLVLSEDDFRTYPIKHAAFVNTARQIFLENELCLLGFSGDDPNFLQWSGWVRDHLGDKARRIYLVGSLNLSAAKRRLLESRGVAPIDLFPLLDGVAREEQDRKCCQLFLSYLESKKPMAAINWRPADQDAYRADSSDPLNLQKNMRDAAFARQVFSEVIRLWQVDFENCPLWLIAPRKVRDLIEVGTGRAPFGYARFLPLLDERMRSEFLSLLLWRKSVALKAFDPADEKELLGLADRSNLFTKKQRMHILTKLLGEARYRRDDIAFTRIASMLEEVAMIGSDAYAALLAERLRWARDGLDYAVVEKGIDNLNGPSPIWTLVRAGFYFEIGKSELAEALAQKSREDMADRARRDRSSASAASRFAWANVLTRAIEFSKTWSRQPREADEGLSNGYDAQEDVELLSLEIRDRRLQRVEELNGFQPAFGAGHFKDHSRTVRFGGRYVGEEAETVFRLADDACLPLEIGNVEILSSPARYALDAEPLYTLNWYLRLIRAVTKASSPFLEKHFSDIAIAKMSPEVASELFERVLSAARFWHRKANRTEASLSSSNADHLGVLIEILSRLAVRSDSDRAIMAFRFGVSVTTSPMAVYPSLYEFIEHLLDRSVLSLSPEGRADLALECLEFPLPAELPQSPFRWPNPASCLFSHRVKPNRPDGDSRWRAAVAKLLTAARLKGRVRSAAVHRLAYLSAFDCLDRDEQLTFGRVLWSARNLEADGLPSDVDLYPHVTAALPSPGDIHPGRIVYSALFEAPFERSSTDSRLRSIAGAAKGGAPMPGLLPKRDAALWLLGELPSLMPEHDRSGDPFRAQIDRDRIHFIGEVIGRAILPQLLPDDLDEGLLAFVYEQGTLGRGGGALAGWHELARLRPTLLTKIVSDLKRAIRRGDLFDTASAAFAVGTWAAGFEKGHYPSMPDPLKDSLLSSLESRSYESLQPRLWATRQLFKNGGFSEIQLEGLAEAIRDLSTDLVYEAMPYEGVGAVGITSARAEFVRLVRDFLDAGRPCPAESNWVLVAARDPLPEVRFAEEFMG
jgi:hypothetical protein